jgi:GTP-binding protein
LRNLSVSFAGSAGAPAQFPSDGRKQIAFLGRSNVGKSSVLNALAGARGLARVSSTPGRTRTLNFFLASAPGELRRGIYLVDVPGYGFSKAPRALRDGWERLVTAYLAGRDRLALCVLLVDARHEPTDGDHTAARLLERLGLPYVLAANKADKLGRADAARRRAGLARGLGAHARAVFVLSAERGDGIEDLWRTIRAALTPARVENADER